MGFIDGLTAEDRVQVKFSDFYNLVRGKVKAELMVNAIKCEVPYCQILQMMTGESDLLSAYKATKLSPEEIKGIKEALEKYQETGLSPEKLSEVDELYSDMCKTVANLKRRNEELEKVALQATEDQGEATQAENTESAAEPTDVSSDNFEGGDNLTEPKEKQKRQIDIGKIMALKNAGWKIKDIADEMRMEPQAVSNAIWRHKKSLEGKDNEKS